MDSLSNTFCTAIVSEILEYVEEEAVKRQEAAENENFAATTENSEVEITGLKKTDQECDDKVFTKFTVDILEEAKKMLIDNFFFEVSTDDSFDSCDT